MRKLVTEGYTCLSVAARIGSARKRPDIREPGGLATARKLSKKERARTLDALQPLGGRRYGTGDRHQIAGTERRIRSD